MTPHDSLAFVVGYSFFALVLDFREKAGRVGDFWRILLALPSTILHELAHFTIALVLFAKPTRFSVWPRRAIAADGSTVGWVLGEVQMGNPHAFARLPVGLAPLYLFPVGLYYALPHWWTALDSYPFFWKVFLAHAPMALVMPGLVPSPADMRVAFSSLTGLIFYTAAGVSVLLFLFPSR